MNKEDTLQVTIKGEKPEEEKPSPEERAVNRAAENYEPHPELS